MWRISVLTVILAMTALGCSKAKPAIAKVKKIKSEVASKPIEKTPKPSPYIYKTKAVAERPVRPVTTASREPGPKLPAADDVAEPQ